VRGLSHKLGENLSNGRVRMPTIVKEILAAIKKILKFVSLAVAFVVLVVIFVMVFWYGFETYLLEKTDLFAGVLYPKKFFTFPRMCDGECPPSGADDRLNAGAAYPQTFSFSIRQSSDSFKMSFLGTIFVNKPYKVLHIKELRYEWEGNRGIFSKEQSIKLSVNRYIAQDGWYWYGWLGNFFQCDFFECNFEKLFVGKKPGDKFRLSLELVYSFDDEPEKIQNLEYIVNVHKGKYIPFLGF
jgi:hypothetical protein